MTKEERLYNLCDVLMKELGGPILYIDAYLLLRQFIYGFNIKKNHDTEGRFLHRIWYKLVALPVFLDGYIRDVRLNHLIGRRLFGEHYRFGTLTATLKRTKENANPLSREWALAKQVCEVLNDYDPEHC